MKKQLLVIALLIVSGASSFASHLMGGQITSRNIGGLTYEVTLTAYRDILGIPISTTADFHYSDLAGTWTLISSAVASPAVNFGNGVEQYTYVDIITFPVAVAYNVYFEDCCRNFAILNMSNAGGESFHLNNTLLADPTNSSPVFLNPPIPVAQVNVAFNYNPLPFDVDGDSIVWSLDTPLTGANQFVSGYTLPPSDSSVAFTMNTSTGEISFLPNTLGNFVVSVLVSEYRAGVKIGEIRRDMQILVVPSANRVVSVISGSNLFPYSGKNFTVNQGTPFTLTVACTDIDLNNVSLSAHGEPLQFANNPASFIVTTAVGSANGAFSWTPNISQARILPYIVALRVTEDFGGYSFESDITYTLHIGNSATSVIENKHFNGISNVYPNPSQGNFTAELNMKNAGTVTLRVRSLTGQQVALISDVKVNAGINAVDVNNLQLVSGKYFISIEENGKVTSVKGFEIAK